MIDMVVDQGPLGLTDRLFDGMKLLGQIQTRPALREHLDHPTKVTLGSLQSLNDIRMGFVDVCHPRIVSPLGG
jgi:hypothetical protein